MAKRKYLSEFAISMVGSQNALLQQSELERSDLATLLPDARFHIYMIVRRPRIAWIPDSLKVDDQEFSGNFTIQRGNALEKYPFKIPHQLGADQIHIDCPYPHTEYWITNNQSNCLGHGKVAMALAHFEPSSRKYMDLEVLYVGQAYGEGGSRVAPDRLKSHSTLQGIYAEAIRRSPDQDIWIVLWEFDQALITTFDGREGQIFETTTEQDDEHLVRVTSSRITEQQRINFTEAALIRYFQPAYNTTFKETFPSSAHKTYSECYNLDLNAINVELRTDNLMCRLWSAAVLPTWIHLATYELNSIEQRKSMFDFDLSNGSSGQWRAK